MENNELYYTVPLQSLTEDLKANKMELYNDIFKFLKEQGKRPTDTDVALFYLNAKPDEKKYIREFMPRLDTREHPDIRKYAVAQLKMAYPEATRGYSDADIQEMIDRSGRKEGLSLTSLGAGMKQFAANAYKAPGVALGFISGGIGLASKISPLPNVLGTINRSDKNIADLSAQTIGEAGGILYEWGKKQSDRIIYGKWSKDGKTRTGGDLQLQAYLEWVGGNPYEVSRTFEKGMPGRLTSSVLTSMATIILATAVAGPGVGVATGVLLEASDEYDSIMEALKETGLSEDELRKKAEESAFIYGAIAGALDSIVPISISNGLGFGKSFSSKAFKTFAKKYAISGGGKEVGAKILTETMKKNASILAGIGKIVSSTAIDMGLEASTEGAQFIAQELVTRGYAKEQDIDMEMISDILSEPELLESMAGGLIGGGISVTSNISKEGKLKERRIASQISKAINLLEKEGDLTKDELSNLKNIAAFSFTRGLSDESKSFIHNKLNVDNASIETSVRNLMKKPDKKTPEVEVEDKNIVQSLESAVQVAEMSAGEYLLKNLTGEYIDVSSLGNVENKVAQVAKEDAKIVNPSIRLANAITKLGKESLDELSKTDRDKVVGRLVQFFKQSGLPIPNTRNAENFIIDNLDRGNIRIDDRKASLKVGEVESKKESLIIDNSIKKETLDLVKKGIDERLTNPETGGMLREQEQYKEEMAKSLREFDANTVFVGRRQEQKQAEKAETKRAETKMERLREERTAERRMEERGMKRRERKMGIRHDLRKTYTDKGKNSLIAKVKKMEPKFFKEVLSIYVKDTKEKSLILNSKNRHSKLVDIIIATEEEYASKQQQQQKKEATINTKEIGTEKEKEIVKEREKEVVENPTAEKPKEKKSKGKSKLALAHEKAKNINFQTPTRGRQLAKENPELFKKVVAKLAETYPQVTVKNIEDVLDVSGLRVLGLAIGNVVAWSESNAQVDTAPHEYTHLYISLLKDKPLIASAIKRFGSEEALVDAIGQYYVDRIQKVNKSWLSRFWNAVKAVFGNKKAMVSVIGEDFFNGLGIENGGMFNKKTMSFQEAEDSVDEGNAEWDSQNGDAVVHKFDQSSVRVFDYKNINVLTKAEVSGLLNKARVLNKDVGGLKAIRQFVNYFKSGEFGQTKQRQAEMNIGKNPLTIKQENEVVKLFQHANNVVPREKRILLEYVKDIDGNYTVDIKGEEDKRSGHKVPEFEKESFMDALPGDIGINTFMLRFKDVLETRKGKNGEWYKSARFTINDVFVRGLNNRIGRNEDIPMALVCPKAGDKSSFVITYIPEWTQEMGKSRENVEEYLDIEIRNGFMADIHKQDILNYGDENISKNPMAYAQGIARHEWWKAVRHEKYLFDKSKGVHDDMNRTRGDFAEGQVIYGSGEYKLSIFNPEGAVLINRDNGQKMPLMEDYINSGTKRYRFDGAIFMSAEKLDIITQLSGREPYKGGESLADLKPYIKYTEFLDDSGSKSYIQVKMAAFAAGNFEIRDSEGFIIYETKQREDGRYDLYDANGNYIDILSTRNEVKRTSGEFDKDNVVHTLPETAFRVLQTPKELGKTNVASATFGWTDLMLGKDLLGNKEFDAARKVISEHIVKTANKNIEDFLRMRQGGDYIFDAIKSLNILRPDEFSKSFENVASKLDDSSGNAFLHPTFVFRWISRAVNHFIKQGAYKGRNYFNGTFTTVAPNYMNDIADGEVELGADNAVILSNVMKQLYGEAEYEDMMLEYLDSTEDEKDKTIAGINNMLKDKEVFVLSSRQPIPDVVAVSTVRVKRLTRRVGDIAMYSPKTTYGRLQADSDGDHTAIEFFDPEVINSMNKLINSQAYKNRQINNRMEIFKHTDYSNTRLTNFNDIAMVSSKVYSSGYSQGEVTNLKTVRGTLAYKNFVMKFKDGSVSTFIDENELVVMDYALLDKEILLRKNENGKTIYETLIDDGTEVVDKDGNVVKLEDINIDNTTKTKNKPKVKVLNGVASVKKAASNGDGINTLRTDEKFHYGNPFTPLQTKTRADIKVGTVKEAVDAYKEWLDGSNYKDIQQERRQWILDQIDSGKLDGKTLLYYKRGYYSHADALADFIIKRRGLKNDTNVYLKTTSAHEMSILLQAAVDNVKELLLSDWGYNGYEFLTKRIIKNIKSVENSYNVGALMGVVRMYKYSQRRQGLNSYRNEANLSELAQSSKEVYDLMDMDDKKLLRKIKENAYQGEDKRMESVSTNGKVTILEEVLSMYHKTFNEIYGNTNYSEGGLFYLPKAILENAHTMTIAKLFGVKSGTIFQKLQEIGVTLTSDEIQTGKKFGKKVGNAFYDALDKNSYYRNEIAKDEDSYVARPEYNEAIGQFVDNWIDRFTALPKNAQIVSTFEFLNGIHRIKEAKVGSEKIKNVVEMLPIELMSEEALTIYFNEWAKSFDAVQGSRIKLKPEKQRNEIKERYGCK